MAWFFFLAGFLGFGGALLLRHAWFQTSAWDLAIFSQAVDLIGRGLPAHSSLLGFHILGDHGALVLYPLAVLARLLPVPWLLIILQSAALAAAVFPLDRLGRRRGLRPAARALSLAVLLLYPVVFNTAIFDFHPEVLAFPLVFEAIARLERGRPRDQLAVVVCLLLALTCKLALALLVIGFALAALIRGMRRLALVLLGLARAWLAAIGGVLMPAFGGVAAGLQRHGEKFGLDPGALGAGADPLQAWTIAVGNLFCWPNLGYVLLLMLPVMYVFLHRQPRRFLLGLLPFLPLMLVNLTAASLAMKDLVHHYSLFLVPFLVTGVQQTLVGSAAGGAGDGYGPWLRPRLLPVILAWAVLSFLIFSRVSFFATSFRDRLDTAEPLRAAIALIRPDASVLTANQIAPHLARRPVLALTSTTTVQQLGQYQVVLLDRRHPGWKSSPKLVAAIIERLRADPCVSLRFDRGGVLLFDRAASFCPVHPPSQPR
jgi:uncharacterized membrane protein